MTSRRFCHAPTELMALADHVGLLIVDESFADPHPDLSVAAHANDHIIVLRSFGKFYSLAGVRLGFVLSGDQTCQQLAEMAGPWSVSGPALSIGQYALHDHIWTNETTHRLLQDTERLDRPTATSGWTLVGGTALFRTYEVADSTAAGQFCRPRYLDPHISLQQPLDPARNTLWR